MTPSQEHIRRLLEAAKLVFGATSLGNLFREIPDVEKSQIVDSWIESTVAPVIIDSAGKYGAGLSLEVIGRELERSRIEGRDVYVSNKLGWRRKPLSTPEPTFEPGAWFGLEHDALQDISYDGILRCYEEGNQLLGHAAEFVSVHDPDEYLAAATDEADKNRRWEDILGAYRALAELRDDGQVMAVGVGSKTWQTIEELSQHIELDWAMFANSCTILDHPAELLAFIDHLASRGTAIINSALFHGGFLLGGEFFDYRKLGESPEDLKRLAWRNKFHAVCERFETKPFDVGVAFGLLIPGVSAVALSSSRAVRTASHVKAVQHATELPGELWLELRSQELVNWTPLEA